MVTYLFSNWKQMLGSAFLWKGCAYTYPTVVWERWWNKCSWVSHLQESQANTPPPPGLPQSGGEGNFGVTLLKSMSRASAAACMSFQGRAFALILRKMSMVVLYVAETPPYNIRKCRLAVLQLHTCWFTWFGSSEERIFTAILKDNKGTILSVGDLSRKQINADHFTYYAGEDVVTTV